MRTAVDLPLPFAPMSATHSPGGDAERQVRERDEPPVAVGEAAGVQDRLVAHLPCSRSRLTSGTITHRRGEQEAGRSAAASGAAADGANGRSPAGSLAARA